MVEKIVLKINLNYKSLSHPTIILSSGVEGDGGIFGISFLNLADIGPGYPHPRPNELVQRIGRSGGL